MKSLILVSMLTAGLAAAAPASADAAGMAAGVSVKNGNVAAHLTLASHRGARHGRHGRHGRHRPRGFGRFGRCETWRFAHRKLNRRFYRVRLQRRIFNRRGHRIFIARAANRRGFPVRVRYNACLHRVMNVTPLRRPLVRHHRRRHRR